MTERPDPGLEPTGEPAGGEPQGSGPETAAAGSPAVESDRDSRRAERGEKRAGNMLPRRERRRFGLERLLARLVATCGVIGIGVALGAILTSSKVQGWITGLVIAGVSVILSAILWSSRQL